MRAPLKGPSLYDLLGFVALLRDDDWSLPNALAHYRDRHPEAPNDHVIALLAAFAVLTGQEEAFDVYGDDNGRGATLYHVWYRWDAAGDPEDAWGLLPQERKVVLGTVGPLLGPDLKRYPAADVFRSLLHDGRVDDAELMARAIFLDQDE